MSRLSLSAPLALAAVLLAPLPASAAEFDPEGKYELIMPPQPTEAAPGKVEVVDVFWFGCPHCFTFLPVMERFEQTKPDFVEIRRLPAIFRDSWEVHARAFYTAQLLGVAAQIHRPFFESIHVGKQRLDTPEEVQAFFADYGVSAEDFQKTWKSFAVESQVRKSKVMQGRYGVRGTPSVIIAGKYRTSGGLAGSYENVIKVIEALADKERKENMAAR